jgi:hypothetical protein
MTIKKIKIAKSNRTPVVGFKPTNSGLGYLKQAAKRVPNKVSVFTAKRSKKGYSNL